MTTTRRLSLLLLLATCLGLAACGGGSAAPSLKDPGGLGVVDTLPIPERENDGPGGGDDPGPSFGGGVLVRFDVGTDVFHVWVTDESAMDRLVDIYEGREPFSHFSGLLRGGHGASDHNLPWSWYIPGDNVVLNVPHDPLTSYRGSPTQVEFLYEQIVAQNLHYAISAPTAALTGLTDYR